MDDTIFASVYLGDARLAAHAVSATAVWLWSTDGTRILWANPAGCAALGAKTSQALLQRRFAIGDGARTHIERLAQTLPDGDGARLFRLRGFAGTAWSSLTCSCARFDLGRTPGILVIATEPVGADMPLAEQVRRLGFPEPAAVAAFGPDGAVLFATSLAERRLAGAQGLEAIGAAGLASAALAAGSARGHTSLGAVILQRIGRGASTVLLAEFPEPAAARSAVADAARPAAAAASQPPANGSAAAPDGHPALRRHPLRFVWRMDSAGRFSLGSESSADIIDTLAEIVSGRPWHDINAELGLDPTGRVAQAIASRETWSNIAISWPVEGSDERLEVELAGLPSFDRDRNFTGYRGFGVCRDVAQIERLAALRRLPATAPSPSPRIGTGEPEGSPIVPASSPPGGAAPEGIRSPATASSGPPSPGLSSAEGLAPMPAPAAPNVVRFPGAGAFAEARAAEAESPALSAGERSAFHELTRQLTVRLQTGEPAPEEPHAPVPANLSITAPTGRLSPAAQVPARAAAWMFDDARPVFAAEDHLLLNRLPVGILVYRYEELLFANRAFLAWTGYPDLAAMRMAGGLDALFLDAGVGALADSGQDGRHLAIATRDGDRVPVDGRLFAIHWDGEQAFAVLLFKTAAHEQMRAAEVALARAEALARELGMLLDRVADAILVVDRAGTVVCGHGGGTAFFGRGGDGLVGAGFESLFAPDARAAAAAHLARVAGEGGTVAAELTALASNGELRPMMVTIARIDHGQGPWGQGLVEVPGHRNHEPAGSEPGASRSSGTKSSGTESSSTRSSGTRSSGTGRLSVVLRDMSAVRQSGSVDAAALLPGTAALDSAGALAKLCHEARGPIRSILESCDLMLAERFGPIGTDRYRDCIRDIGTAGTQALSRLADAAGLAEIIAGTSRLSVVRVSLNEAVNACVTEQQGAANEARVVIRTALSPGLPPILADAEAVRAMTVALLLHALQTTRPGGQVIVSTGRSPGGFVVLRVRDNGEGLYEKAVEAALRPSPQPPTDRGELSGLTGGLALAKALADANQAHFAITSKPHQGSLFEVTFAAGPASEAPVPDRQARDDPGMTPVDGNQKY